MNKLINPILFIMCLLQLTVMITTKMSLLLHSILI